MTSQHLVGVSEHNLLAIVEVPFQNRVRCQAQRQAEGSRRTGTAAWISSERNWQRPVSASAGRDALSRFREQQAMIAAKAAIKRHSALAQYELSDVAEAMVRAKPRCLEQ